MFRNTLLLLFSLFVMLSFDFKKGKNRIVFLGDSITAAGVESQGYITILEKMMDSTGIANQYHLIGAGISGNRVPDLQKRLQKDVLSKKPDLVVIYIGINDVWHWHHECCKNSGGGTKKDEFEKGLEDIIAKLKAKDVKVVLCTPTVIGEKAPGDNELDEQLDEYSDVSRKIAKENHVTLLDLREIFKNYIKDNISKNNGSGILTFDGVHLNDFGNKFLAEQMYPVITSIEYK